MSRFISVKRKSTRENSKIVKVKQKKILKPRKRIINQALKCYNSPIIRQKTKN